jgi:hypothetical protein
MPKFSFNNKWYEAPTYMAAKALADAEAKLPKSATPSSAPVVTALNPLAAAVRGVATPVAVLATRGKTGPFVHLGVGEQVRLSLNTPTPPVGFEFKWSIQGDAELTSETATTALLTAGITAGNVTATLKINGGPHNGHKLSVLEFKVVAPTGTRTSQDPNQPLLRHVQHTAGLGFKMWINLLPDNVVFSNVQWREHTGMGMGTGHFEGENGRIHAPSGVAYNAQNQPVNTLSSVWMPVYGVLHPPYGNNWVGQVDNVDTGSHPPAVAATATVPAKWNASSHFWHIEWRYRVKRSNNTYGPECVLERAMHEAKIDVNGRATIKKGDAGPFSVEASAPLPVFHKLLCYQIARVQGVCR